MASHGTPDQEHTHRYVRLRRQDRRRAAGRFETRRIRQPVGRARNLLAPADYDFRMADEVATHVVISSGTYLKCALTSLDQACLTTFLNDFGARAWRRPIADAERTKLGQ